MEQDNNHSKFIPDDNQLLDVYSKTITEVVKKTSQAVAAHPFNLTQRMIGANHLTTKTGVYVFEILNDANIQNQELKVGDIIVEFSEKPVATVDNLHKYLTEEVIGKKTSLTVLRSGRKQIITVIPGDLR